MITFIKFTLARDFCLEVKIKMLNGNLINLLICWLDPRFMFFCLSMFSRFVIFFHLITGLFISAELF